MQSKVNCHYTHRDENKFQIVIPMGVQLSVTGSWLVLEELPKAYTEVINDINNDCGFIMGAVASRFAARIVSGYAHLARLVRRLKSDEFSITAMALEGL